MGASILNSVHYYQKFKLKCDLLHPLDLLLVIEKIKSESRTSNGVAMHDERIEGIKANMNGLAEKISEMIP